MRKSLLLAILGIGMWLFLTMIPVPSVPSSGLPMSTLASCAINQKNSEQLNCECYQGGNLSFSYRKGQLTMQCS